MGQRRIDKKATIATNLSLHDQSASLVDTEEYVKMYSTDEGRCCYNSGSFGYTAFSIVVIEQVRRQDKGYRGVMPMSESRWKRNSGENTCFLLDESSTFNKGWW